MMYDWLGVTSTRHESWRVWLIAVAAWALVAVTATALGQDPSDRIEISSLDFTGNDTFSDGELLDLMATRESSGFFGLFLHSISESFANGRKYLDPLTFSDDLKAIRVHYEDHGFASVRVDTAVVFDAEDNSVAIHILIDEGYRSLVDSVHYAGLLNVAGEVWCDRKNIRRPKGVAKSEHLLGHARRSRLGRQHTHQPSVPAELRLPDIEDSLRAIGGVATRDLP